MKKKPEKKKEPKKKTGPVSKIHAFVDEAKKYLEAPDNDNVVIILTDEELVDDINSKLADEDKISYRSFKRWKAKSKDDLVLPANEKEVEVYELFTKLIQKALIDQKKNLFRMMAADDKAWTRWAWIIERKFEDWNLKKIVEAQITPPKKEMDYAKLSIEERVQLLKLHEKASLT